MRIGSFYRDELLMRLGLWGRCRKSDSVLDIGGYDGYAASRLPCGNATVIDPDAKRRFINVNYIADDFLLHDFADQHFDCILMLDVLEHLPAGSEAETVNRAFALLKPGGSLYVTVPSDKILVTPHWLTGAVSRWLWGHRKCRGYSPQQLRSWIQAHGGVVLPLPCPTFLRYYVTLWLARWFIPSAAVQHLLSTMAQKDAVATTGCNGYYLCEMKARIR